MTIICECIYAYYERKNIKDIDFSLTCMFLCLCVSEDERSQESPDDLQDISE